MNQGILSNIHLDLSDQKDLYRYLIANLEVSGALSLSWASRFSRACQWYADLLGLGFDKVPFFLVHDLGFLFLLGNRFPFRVLEARNSSLISEEDEEKNLRKTLRATYENRVLNRVLSLPIFYECSDVLEEKGKRREIIVLFLERLLEPFKEAPLPFLLTTPYAVRSTQAPSSITPEEASKDLDQFISENWPEVFSEGTSFSFCELQCQIVSDFFEMLPLHKTLGPEDVFIARHYDLLGNRAQRLVVRKISEFEGLLGSAPPPPSEWAPESPEVKVDLEDAGFFPQGGLDEMATRGSIENLVQSQLALIEDTKGPDLFSLRYIEGELLYYTRDEGQLLRRSRAVHLLCEMNEDYDFQYPGQPSRLSVLLKSFLNQFVEDLFSVFESDSLQIILHAIGKQGKELAKLWGIRFSERVEKGEVQVHIKEELGSLEEIPSPYVVPGRISSFVYVGPREKPPEDLRLQHFRSNLAVFWAKLDFEEKSNWGGLTEANQKQWAFDIGVSTDQIMPVLSALKTQLVWRTFGF